MDSEIACPHCNQTLTALQEMVGMELECPSCKNSFILPSPSDSTPTAKETKECPYCAETILKKAKKCKYCHEFLDSGPSQESKPSSKGKVPVTEPGRKYDPCPKCKTAELVTPTEKKHGLCLKCRRDAGIKVQPIGGYVGLIKECFKIDPDAVTSMDRYITDPKEKYLLLISQVGACRLYNSETKKVKSLFCSDLFCYGFVFL